MNFSLLLPTRKRPELLTNLCQSIENTASNKEELEVLLAYDTDDEYTKTIIPSLSNKHKWLKAFIRERGDSISRDYQNWLYQKSLGKYIFVLNDDIEFKTSGWDDYAMQKIETYTLTHPDGVIYGWISDSADKRIYNENNSYSCFPLLSRTAIKILGYVMHEHFRGWGADVYLYNVYKSADRILDLSDILVQHYTTWQGNRKEDEVTYGMQDKSYNTNIIDHKEDTDKLLYYINRTILLL